LEGAKSIPLGQLAARLSELDKTREIVLVCRSGSRAARAVDMLLGAGFEKAKKLDGGINAWARQVDPNMRIY
jgi:rhodanese-related sulfurtransferase